MKHFSTIKNSAFLQKLFLVIFISFYVQLSFSQSFDFQQTSDLKRLVVMEAENFTTNTPSTDASWEETNDPDSASGGKALMAVSTRSFGLKDEALAGAAKLSYKINFTASGKHYIWALASRTSGSDDSYYAGIDGTIHDSADYLAFHTTTLLNDWVWIHYRRSVGPGFIEVPTVGVHELTLFIRENGFKIDKIILTKSSDYVPDGTGPEETLAPSSLHNNLLDNDAFSIYPLPANDELNITINNENYLNGILKITDLQGKTVDIINIDNTISKKIDISNIEPGLYFVNMEYNGRLVSVNKFLKQ